MKGRIKAVDTGTKLTPAQVRFIAAFAETGNRTEAARLAKVSRVTTYQWGHTKSPRDKEFRRRFKEAHKQACGLVDDEIQRRAITGVKEPVYQGGKRVGTVRKYSDTLLIFLAKALMPNKYRELREVRNSGTVNGRVEVRYVDDWHSTNLVTEADGTPEKGAG